METYEQSFGRKHVERARQMLATATEKYEDLDFITHEGVTGITLTLESDSKTLTLRLPADVMGDLSDPLHRYQGEQVSRLEASLQRALQEWGEPEETTLPASPRYRRWAFGPAASPSPPAALRPPLPNPDCSPLYPFIVMHTPLTSEQLNDLAVALRANPATTSAGQHRVAEQVLLHMQQAWARLNAQYQQLLSMEEEGIYEVTLRTPSQTITLAVDVQNGTGLAVDMWEMVSKRMERKEADILDQYIELAAQAADADRPDLSATMHALCAPSEQQPVTPVPVMPFPATRRPVASSVVPHAATA